MAVFRMWLWWFPGEEWTDELQTVAARSLVEHFFQIDVERWPGCHQSYARRMSFDLESGEWGGGDRFGRWTKRRVTTRKGSHL